ncbi:MAG TPA: hypothetical protein VE131_09755 [Terriglobales bacterium]|nr:hypothetical protein [Terriglobales bacterium]
MKLLKNRRRWVPVFSLLAALGASALAVAEQPSPSVQVSIGTILASNQSDEFDAQLKGLESQLRVLKYRSYRLLKNESQSMPWYGHKDFTIPGGRFLTVTPQEIRNNQISLKVRLTQGQKPLIDTTVRIPNRGNFLLGGPPHEGGALVLSISASAQ